MSNNIKIKYTEHTNELDDLIYSTNNIKIQNIERTNDWVDWVEEVIGRGYYKLYEYKYFHNIQEIGSSPFGKVYCARWKNSEQRLALKSFFNLDDTAFKELIDELKRQRDIQFHDNIIQFYGIAKFESDNQNDLLKRYLLVMEYADSGALNHYLEKNFNNLTWNNKYDLAYQLACAVSCLHDEEIVHSNLHPGNVMVNKHTIKVSGLSKRIRVGSKQLEFREIPYTDPKTFNKRKNNNDSTQILHQKNDIYSIGVLLWQISSGRPPFSSEEYDINLIMEISQGRREESIPGTPKDYTKLYTDCWDGELDKRPTINQVVERLKVIMTTKPSINDSYDNQGNDTILTTKPIININHIQSGLVINKITDAVVYLKSPVLQPSGKKEDDAIMEQEIQLSTDKMITEHSRMENHTSSNGGINHDSYEKDIIISTSKDEQEINTTENIKSGLHQSPSDKQGNDTITTMEYSITTSSSSVINQELYEEFSNGTNTKDIMSTSKNEQEINAREIVKSDLQLSDKQEIFNATEPSIVIKGIVEYIFKLINLGKEAHKHIFDYFDFHKIKSREIYNWLLNNQNDLDFNFLLGYFNYVGIETSENLSQAFDMFIKASEQDHTLSQLYVGLCYEFGYGTKKNEKLAFEYFEKVANKNQSSGINYIGYFYERGIGIKKDLKKAASLYEKAAKLGNCIAQYNLAVMYINKMGIDKDDYKAFIKAFELSKQSAEEEYISGIRMLGYCYSCGIGTSVNKQKAFELYQQAANLGDIDAQYNLGDMYEKGEGTEKDINKAIYWFKRSTRQGDQDAQNRLKNLNNYHRNIQFKEIRKHRVSQGILKDRENVIEKLNEGLNEKSDLKNQLKNKEELVEKLQSKVDEEIRKYEVSCENLASLNNELIKKVEIIEELQNKLNEETSLNNQTKNKDLINKLQQQGKKLKKQIRETTNLLPQIQTKSTELKELIDRTTKIHNIGKQDKVLMDNMLEKQRNFILGDNSFALEELKGIKQKLFTDYELLTNEEIKEILDKQEEETKLNIRLSSMIQEESMISSLNIEQKIGILQTKLDEEIEKYQNSLEKIIDLNIRLEEYNDVINKFRQQTDELKRQLNEVTEKYQNSQSFNDQLNVLISQIKTKQTEIRKLVDCIDEKYKFGIEGKLLMDNILEKQRNIILTNNNSDIENLEITKQKLNEDYRLTEEEIRDILYKQTEKTKLGMQLESMIQESMI